MSLVIDASALLPALIEQDRTAEAVRRVAASEDLIAPHLLDMEVAQSLRRQERHIGTIAVRGFRRFRLLTIRRFDHLPLLPRIWELRHNLTAYDAAYVALAEVTRTPLLTLDRKLANAPGHHADVIVL